MFGCVIYLGVSYWRGWVLTFLYVLRKYRETLKSVKDAQGTVVSVDGDDSFVSYNISSKDVLNGTVVKTSLYPSILKNCIKVGDTISVKFLGDEEVGSFFISEEPFSRLEILQGLLISGSARCRRVTVFALVFAFVAVVLSLLV